MPTTTTETVTKTVIVPLETSGRKNARVEEAIEEWQEIAGRMADLMPSLGGKHWRSQDSTVFRVVNNEFPDHSLRAHDAHQAGYKVAEAFGSWDSRGRPGRRPEFGTGDYCRFCHCGVTVAENDAGFGIKVGMEPYKPEWWRVKQRPYIAEWLERAADGAASSGAAELHLDDDGGLRCHLSVSTDVDVLDASDAARRLGVDVGEKVIYAAAVLDGEETVDVEVRGGGEFRHNRERLKRKRQEMGVRGDLRGIKQCEDEHRRYTDHITHVVSREIVDMAVENSPCAIVLEDLGGYRESAEDAIHDWPFAEIHEKIAYKATEEGIPVTFTDPAGTSRICSCCGRNGTRDGRGFECPFCGYEVHSDVNAAKNIASGA